MQIENCKMCKFEHLQFEFAIRWSVAAIPTSPIRSQPLVRLDHVGVDFGRQQVLRDIDLTISRGQTLAVIGESGCGKTVLLKTIIGLLRPTRGAVYFDGRNLAGWASGN